LTFALGIEEQWKRYGRNENWAEWEVLPASAWNYGLVFNDRWLARSFDVERKKGPLPKNPFTPQTAPIVLKAKAKKIPNWQADKFGMVAKLQRSPVQSDEPTETIKLIPMGAARLRISAFPVIGTGRDA